MKVTMLKVVLVDDEQSIRQGLGRLIDWNSLGFEIVADFENGYDALHYLEENTAHLAIVDINMPFLDGLALVEKLRPLCRIEIIILSGFNEFNYAQKAMQFGVRHYLLKPVDEDQLIAALKDIQSEIEDREKNADLMKNSESFLKQKLLEELLLFELSEKDYQAVCDSFNLSGGNVEYRILCIRFFRVKVPPLDLVNDFLAEHFQGHYIYKAIFSQGMVYIFCRRNINESYLSATIALSICDFLKTRGFDFSMAIGKSVDDIRDFPISKTCAQQGIEKAFYIGLNQCIDTEEEGTSGDRQSSVLLWNDAGLLSAIKVLSIEKISEETNILFQEFEDRFTSRSMVNTVITNIVYNINSLLLGYESSINILYGRKIELDELFSDIHTLADLKRWFDAFLSSLVTHIQSLRKEKISDVVWRAKGIVDNRFADDIYLKDIASQLYISADYLGRQFRECLGLSFNEYIAKKRIEHAKELLLTSRLNVYEIAHRCGFQSVDYFTKQFKKITGQTPGSIRRFGI